MREVSFHRLARREIHEALDWYGERSPLARERFRLALIDATERIVADPLSHAVLAAPYRCVRVRRFPYVLIFEELAGREIVVIAVAHTSRRQGYWQRRK